MAPPSTILIICGEPSGDLHAGTLARQLKRLKPEMIIKGVGGDHLRSAGAQLIHDIKDMAVLGFFDVFKKLPLFLALKKKLLAQIRESPPQAIVLIDFSGFNLRLLRSLPEEIPVFYYIAPQVWASRESRVRTLKKYIRKMLVLFSFEEEFYKKHGVPVEWVGHPLLDIVKPAADKNAFLSEHGLREEDPIIALLPGSRAQEIRYILPRMAAAAQLIAKEKAQSKFIVAKSANVTQALYTEALRPYKLGASLIEGKTYDCINAASVCLVASGTATLETALLEKPFLIIYRMNLLNYLLYKPQIKLPCIGLVNIIAGKQIVPEFIQFQAHPQAIARAALGLLNDQTAYDEMKRDLAGIKSSLGECGAARRAAQAILSEL